MQGVEGKRIAALIGDGFEEQDLTEPRRALEEAGAVVTIVGIDERSRQRIRGKRGLDDGAALKAEELDCRLHGRGFRRACSSPVERRPTGCARIATCSGSCASSKRRRSRCSSIGHGAQVLISAQVVRGRQLTGANSIADDIRNAGGLYRDQPTVSGLELGLDARRRGLSAVQSRDAREARNGRRSGRVDRRITFRRVPIAGSGARGARLCGMGASVRSPGALRCRR